MLDTEQTWRVSIEGAIAGHIIHGVSPPCHCFLGGDFHTGTSCSCSGSRSHYGYVLAVGRTVALLFLSFVLLLFSAIAVSRAAAPLLLLFVLLLHDLR